MPDPGVVSTFRRHRYTHEPVKSSVEALEGNKVKLYVEIDEAEFDRDIDRAFKEIAREVKLPGFRNGKAPRRVLEARIGLGPAREQALRSSIPEYLARAVREHGVDLIATPEIEITAGQDDGPVEFDATCQIRPEITVPGYGGLRVELPALDVADALVDQAVDQERRRHGALNDVERPAARGDHVVIDMAATRDGQELAGLNPQDWTYEIGQGWIADDFDEQLIGASAADVLEFSTVPKGTEDPADFVVTVQAVKELVLPELDDEWVADHLGEFESVDAWRADIRARLGQRMLDQVRSQVVARVTEALAQLVDEDPPEVMVANETRSRLERTAQQFQAQGIDLNAWLSATGQSPEEFVKGLEAQAAIGVKVDLALRAVAVAEGLTIGDDELEAEYERIAVQVGQKPKAVRQAYERNHAVDDLTAQLLKSKALDWLLHHVEMVDPEGQLLDRELILGDHDHDDPHDHDHDAGSDTGDGEPT